MASTNDFLVQLLAKLDTSSVNAEYEALKKRLTNDPVIQKITLDTSMSRQAIRAMASEIHNELGKAFKATGIEDFNITVKDVESILTSAVKESNKLAKELENASSKAQKFLAQFNNKSGGTLINSKEFKDVQAAIDGLGKTHSIDDLNKSMNTLETTYNNMVSNLRNSGRSLNPFINAKNEMATMDDTIKGISLEFERLSSKPKDVSNAIKELSVQQEKVNSYVVGTQEWAAAYGQLQQMIQKVNAEISNLRKAQSAKVSTQIFNTSDLQKNDIAYMTKVFNTIEKQMVEINHMANGKGWTIVDVSGVERADGLIKSLTLTIRDSEGALKRLNMQREKLQGSGKAQDGLMQVGDVKVIETASQAQQKLAQETEKANAELAKQVTRIQNLSTGGVKNDYATQISRLTGQFRSLGLTQEDITKKTAGVTQAFEALKSRLNQPFDESNYQEIIALNDRLQKELAESSNEYTQLSSSARGLVTAQQRLSLANTIVSWNQKNTKATREVRAANDEYVRSLQNLNVAMTRVEFNKINTSFKQAENTMRGLGKLGLSLRGQFSQAASSFSTWLSASSAVMLLISQLRKMPSAVKELDDAITDLTMATGASKEQVEAYTESYAELADQLSSTVTDVTVSGTAWLKQGKSIEETEVLIADAMILAKLGQLDSAEATEYLTSAQKGYNVAVEDTLDVVDKLSAVDLISATDVGGLAEGMSRVANNANLAGISMDRLLGYLAAIGEVTQRSMSEVGTTLNAIFSRMGNIKLSRLKDYQNESGEDLSNVETVLRGQGIALRDSAGEFRNFGEVLDEVASRWDEFGSVSQRAIASAFAG